MPGIHRLEHVKGLFAATLADDDAVGPHAQRVFHEFPLANLASALRIGRSRLQPTHMGLLQLQFGRIAASPPLQTVPPSPSESQILI
jgi:hypothetical protein